MKGVRVLITPELMRQCLSLPDHVKIVAASWADHYIELVIVSEDIIESSWKDLPLAQPTFERRHGADVTAPMPWPNASDRCDANLGAISSRAAD